MCWIIVLLLIKSSDMEKQDHIYNVAAGTEMSNLTFIKLVLKILAKDENAIEFTEDRAGHDLRYLWLKKK